MTPKKIDPALVYIAPPASAGRPLSKAQQEFNRLTTRIAELEQLVQTFRTAGTELRQRVQQEYRPLQARHNAQRAALVQVLDKAHDDYPLTKNERLKIGDLIARRSHDLPERGFPELRVIIDKYAAPPPAAAAGPAHLAQLREFFGQRYGIEFSPEADVSTPEKLRAYVAQQLAAQQAVAAAAAQAHAERRAQRRKTPKQQAAADNKQAEQQSITRAVRTLYLDLVKHLHPDREPDEAEKNRKTELLKQVTTAYEANELLTLLRLQLALRRTDPTHLENLADDQLRYYIALLREQSRELSQALLGEQQALAGFTGRPAHYATTPAALQADFEAQKQQLLAKTEQLAAEVLAFERDPTALKMFLKAYALPS